MGPKKVQISQEAFNAVVKENVEEFDMELAEALEDAIKTFQMQGADLSGSNSLLHNKHLSFFIFPFPLMHSASDDDHNIAQHCKGIAELLYDEGLCGPPYEKIIAAQRLLLAMCLGSEPGDTLVAVKNGGIEASISAYQALKGVGDQWAIISLETLCSLLADDNGRERFGSANGPQIVLEALTKDDSISHLGAAVLAAAATKNERLKEMFMDLGADCLLVEYLKRHQFQRDLNSKTTSYSAPDAAALQAGCDAIFSLVTADDMRPAASKAYGNAMKIAKAGAVDAILAVLPNIPKSTPILSTLCLTLKSLAVNDEICKTVAEQGGLDTVLQFLDQAIQTGNKVVAKSACALLSQLAGSDANKDAIVSSGGLNQIIALMSAFQEEPAVLQEGFAAIATLTLRSPQNASKAVQAGAVDIAAEMMEKHPGSAAMLRQACQMLRNLSVRNLENRPIILEKGLEPLIRKAKASHESCKDVASAALRDLGFDNYL
ncbi:unnamed protein product [Sphagnum tenellum]